MRNAVRLKLFFMRTSARPAYNMSKLLSPTFSKVIEDTDSALINTPMPVDIFKINVSSFLDQYAKKESTPLGQISSNEANIRHMLSEQGIKRTNPALESSRRQMRKPTQNFGFTKH